MENANVLIVIFFAGFILISSLLLAIFLFGVFWS